MAEANHTYHFDITMTCGGCSGAVERVLKRLDGVTSYTVSLDTQTADVVTDEKLAFEDVLGVIKKTGKAVKSGTADGEVRSVG